MGGAVEVKRLWGVQTLAAARLRAWERLLIGMMAIGGLSAFPLLLPSPYVVQAVDVLLACLLAASLNLLVGYGGMLSLGHAAFFGVGGYVAGILVKRLGIPWFATVGVGTVVAALAAAGIGYFCVRLAGAYFVMLTLAFGQLLYTVFWKWKELTGGDDGLTDVFPPAPWTDPVVYYYLVLLVVGLALWGLWRVCASPFGAALKAVRDSPHRAEAVGIPVRRVQWAAFTLSGGLAGLAGALFVFHHGSMFPKVAGWQSSAEAALMVVLGGPERFVGPLVGAVVIKTLAFLVPRATPYWQFFLGVLLVLAAFLAPRGLVEMRGGRRR
ncbi:MAG: branched-chain amino acid ABC transporter permease [Armatimonadetes bacterium]|nr:branched-chain amino acid ABC transporter permease [Armatimonadota bacterium]MDW8154143.1 branched-chain amino acid ABC transporter permease [Armatimonadota bacterium]